MLHFENIVYGPVHSRRFGTSLGVNLLPPRGKLCNFDCIYCECGWNRDNFSGGGFPSVDEFGTALRAALSRIVREGAVLDSITFSGNGEPTLNPSFPEMVDAALALRDELTPSAKVTVLSNGTTCGKDSVLAALRKVDNPVMKIDAATTALANLINKPEYNYDLNSVVENLRAFDGDFILQTMFLRFDAFDSASAANLAGWTEIVRTLHPRLVMVYSTDRETPQKALHRYSSDEMNSFVRPLVAEGFAVQVYGV